MLPLRYRRKIKIDKKRGCWEWQGEINQNGYGRAWFKGYRYVSHRLMYWLMVKDNFCIENYKVELDHLCENKKCCNPKHMEKVSRKVNAKRVFRRKKRITENGELVR